LAEPVLKFPPEQKGAPSPPTGDKISETPRRSFAGGWRRYRRVLLLVVLPLVAVIGGLVFYLNGGRYVTTDDAYVGAQKVLITPDISGKVSRIVVREGQHVAPGDVLFEIDAEPFRLALAQAQARLAGTRVDFSNFKSNLASLTTLADLAEKNVELKQRDVERKTALVARSTASQLDLDNAFTAVVTAKLEAQLAVQQKFNNLNQLLGNPDLSIEDFPAFRQAKAAVAQAQRDLDHTVLRAPISGTASQVDAIQLGRFVTAGMPVFSVMDDEQPWVDANPKETDVTYLKVGQAVTIDVDTFPDYPFRGTVSSVSPGTGAQYAILPPQNASGNWVKVVQRLPLRIAFAPGQDISKLRSGMSVTVGIDTGHRRSLLALLGLTATAKGD
jgi:membrane fusion protein, multidrug efflux system